jgi:hypothetical protein
MCNICGKNCGKGGALRTHLKGEHAIDYQDYRKCFYPAGVLVLADVWDDSAQTVKKQTVIEHVFVRRLIGNPGKRGVRTTRRPKS